MTLSMSYFTYAQKMLPDVKPYQYTSVIKSGPKTGLMGTGVQINRYIAKKIAKAKKGDTIRFTTYILEYTSRTKYFYDALKTALKNGARVEIITEGKNTSLDDLINGNLWDVRYDRTMKFLYGTNSNIKGITKEYKRHKNSFKLYELYKSGAETKRTNSTYHRKVFLLDINNKREIVISSSNIRYTGEREWQTAIALDGDIYDSQWRWWNDVLDTDICFSKGNRNCLLGDGGYEANYEWSTTSYIIDKRSRKWPQMIVHWLKLMKYKKGCGLRMLMGHIDSKEVLAEMARIAKDGCKVDLIYAKEHLKMYPGENEKTTTPLSYVKKYHNAAYRTGRLEIEQQNGVHSKLILWQGNWWSYTNAKSYIWTGAHNAMLRAEYNDDESMIRIEDRKIFKEFWNFFQCVEFDGNPSNCSKKYY